VLPSNGRFLLRGVFKQTTLGMGGTLRHRANNTKIKGSDEILSADAGQVIGMVLHELATNAAKYGALSNTDGCVWVCWMLDGVRTSCASSGRSVAVPWWFHSHGGATPAA
jgi:two-component sensor histidine kinase